MNGILLAGGFLTAITNLKGVLLTIGAAIGVALYKTLIQTPPEQQAQ